MEATASSSSIIDAVPSIGYKALARQRAELTSQARHYEALHQIVLTLQTKSICVFAEPPSESWNMKLCARIPPYVFGSLLAHSALSTGYVITFVVSGYRCA